MEQIQYNMLFRWFVGLAIDDAVWVPTVFTKNRERLIEHSAIIELFNQVLIIANDKNLLSSEHFSVDGTLIQAWAGHKSFVTKNKASQLDTPANADSVKTDSVKPDSAKQSSDDTSPPDAPSSPVTSTLRSARAAKPTASKVSHAATPPISPPQMLMRACTAKAITPANCDSWDTP
jgi:hypothetical protein